MFDNNFVHSLLTVLFFKYESNDLIGWNYIVLVQGVQDNDHLSVPEREDLDEQISGRNVALSQEDNDIPNQSEDSVNNAQRESSPKPDDNLENTADIASKSRQESPLENNDSNNQDVDDSNLSKDNADDVVDANNKDDENVGEEVKNNDDDVIKTSLEEADAATDEPQDQKEAKDDDKNNTDGDMPDKNIVDENKSNTPDAKNEGQKDDIPDKDENINRSDDTTQQPSNYGDNATEPTESAPYIN